MEVACAAASSMAVGAAAAEDSPLSASAAATVTVTGTSVVRGPADSSRNPVSRTRTTKVSVPPAAARSGPAV